LAGPLSEAQGYFAPGVDLAIPLVYVREFFVKYTLLIALAVVGWPALARASMLAALLLSVILAWNVLVPSFLLQNKTEMRYVLPSLPLLAVLGVTGIARLAQGAAHRLHVPASWHAPLTAVVIVVAISGAVHADLLAASARLRRPTPGPTWLQALQRQQIQPDDLVLTEGPERLRFYLGRADYHVYAHREFYGANRSSEDEQGRYSYAAADGIRSIYADSLVLGQKGDFERLVEQPNHGRTLWVMGSAGRIRHLTEEEDEGLWQSLARSAGRRITTGDGWIIMRIALPLRSRQAGPVAGQ
jgi:hypothetical protein